MPLKGEFVTFPDMWEHHCLRGVQRGVRERPRPEPFLEFLQERAGEGQGKQLPVGCLRNAGGLGVQGLSPVAWCPTPC